MTLPLIFRLTIAISTVCTYYLADAQTVTIEDPILESFIRVSVSKPEGEITITDMETLQHVSAEGVRSLAGLEFAKNLSSALFHPGHISDLSPLAGLVNLTRLELSGRDIEDLSSLSKLINLESLVIRSSSISDLYPLAGLTRLHWLQLVDGIIENVEPLIGLGNLTHLYLSRNRIEDIDALSELKNLEYVYLDYNKISDLSPISGLEKLEFVSACSNLISDLEGVSEPPLLKSLYLRDNRIESLEPLENKHILSLDLSLNAISDLTPLPLSRRVGRGHLDVSYNYLDLSEDSPQSSIISFLSSDHGSGAAFSTIVPISSPQKHDAVEILDDNLKLGLRAALGKPDGPLTVEDMLELTELVLVDEGIKRLNGLEHAINLERLILRGNYIAHLPLLHRMHKLSYLDVSHNQIISMHDRTVGPINMDWEENIGYLDLSHNLLPDIPLVYSLASADYINYSNNPIDFSEGSAAEESISYASTVLGAETIYSSGRYEKEVLYWEKVRAFNQTLLFWIGDGYYLHRSTNMEDWERHRIRTVEDEIWRAEPSNSNQVFLPEKIPDGRHFFRIFDTRL